jgi:hypothetical protein
MDKAPNNILGIMDDPPIDDILEIMDERAIHNIPGIIDGYPRNYG